MVLAVPRFLVATVPIDFLGPFGPFVVFVVKVVVITHNCLLVILGYRVVQRYGIVDSLLLRFEC